MKTNNYAIMKFLSSTFTLLLLFASLGFAQVTIAPTNMFIDNTSGFGTYMVVNGSNKTQEISVDFFFAYSQTDENGNRSIIIEDSVMADRYSVAEYVRAFPRNFTLAPNQRQMVRLRLTAPNDLDDGTYWARIKTTSTPESPPLELQQTESVNATVGIIVEQVTGLFFKKGNVNTGVSINSIRSNRIEDDRMEVLVDYSRSGNSPFLGSVTLTLIDKNGIEVRRSYISTSFYFDGVYKQIFDVSDLDPGDYLVNVLIESRRPDLAESDLVQMQDVTLTESISIR